VVPAVPETIGGSADLTGSNNTRTKAMSAVSARRLLRPLHPLRHPRARHGRGDERHALHGGIIPYGGTFLVFSDYCRPAMRLAALMGTASSTS
jgi:transketolase